MSQIVHTTILINVTQRLFICPTSDKRGHIKRTKRAQNGKRRSQKRRDIESIRATKKAKAKDIKEERFRKEAK
jgi:hypothetical protein